MAAASTAFIAAGLGRARGFEFASPREIVDELRVASKSGVADYSGITYEKIERQYFPSSAGTVTGLVGAAGGRGGFFPPLALGLIRESTGTFTMGFVLLSAFALACWSVCFLGGRARV